MKLSEITDATIDEPNSQLVVELPNGQRMATSGYYFDQSESGSWILVVRAGKKQKKCKY